MTVKNILQIVSKIVLIPEYAIVSKCRKEELVQCRYWVIVISKETKSVNSKNKILAKFFKMHPSTITYAVKVAYDDLAVNNNGFKTLFDLCMKKIDIIENKGLKQFYINSKYSTQYYIK